MPGRMSARQSSRGPRIEDDDDDRIHDLVTKLQQLLPDFRRRHSRKMVDEQGVSASKILQETCNYIRSLRREVDDLSEQLSDLLATCSSDEEAAIIRNLFHLT